MSTPLALLIPDGVGLRNFLHGPFIREAMRMGPLSVWHTIPDDLLDSYRDRFDASLTWHRLIDHADTAASFLLRNALSYAQMYWADTRAMRHSRQQRPGGPWSSRLAVGAARLAGRAGASPGRIRTLDRWHGAVVHRSPAVAEYRRLFRQSRPGVVFCSHQRPPVVLPAVLAARSLGIPTATFIFSWDNLSSKGRIAAPFDHYLVWSEHMRDELLRYYPGVTPDRVHIVGTPQFDPYADTSLLWSREEFFERIGADPARPLVAYSGGDAGTCPEDPQHVRILMELIRAGRIARRPQVIVRPTPVDPGSRYAEVRRAFPELIFAQPAWITGRTGTWAQVLPQAEDVQFLANLTHHADVNVNLASTMTLDFALHDRPVVNVAFDVADPPPFGQPLWQHYYEFEHYRPVVEIGAARFARSRDDLADHVNAYLDNPALDRQARRRLVELEVALPLGQAGRHIVECLQMLAVPAGAPEAHGFTTAARAANQVG